MMNHFQFLRTPHIRFGRGSLDELGKYAAPFGRRALLLTGASSLKASGALGKIESSLRDAKIEFMGFAVLGEPSPDSVDTIVNGGRDFRPECVIAVGGGSVIDAGKAVSAMLPSGRPVKRYLEDVGTEKPSGEKVPMIALPTTSGTGSEATANAVLSEIGENGYKKSLRHANFVPDAAIVDPELSAGCPPSVTAACGMDAFTQLLESYVSTKASPLTDAIAKSGIERVRDSIVPASSAGPENQGAREGMAYAALVSGITLADAGLGAVHGIAGAIGGRFPAPHGAACGALVGPVTRASIAKLMSAKGPRHPALVKYAEIGHLLSNSRFDTIENGCDKLLNRIDVWTRKLHLPALREYGITEPDLDRIAAASINRNNPVKLDENEMKAILYEAL
jgi:alcohol dehydrogenase